MRQKKLIIIFVKNPKLGAVKTRLATSIGDAMALETYKLLLNHTALIASKVQADKVVFYDKTIEKNDLWSSHKFLKAKQSEGDLGKRMNNAFEEAFGWGYEHVIIIGSDLYSLKSEHLENAFENLKTHDVVIGPANDGGYYLLGLKTKIPHLFINKKWSQESVFIDTMEDLKGQSIYLLEILNDIDTFDDLKHEPELIKKLNIDAEIN